MAKFTSRTHVLSSYSTALVTIDVGKAGVDQSVTDSINAVAKISGLVTKELHLPANMTGGMGPSNNRKYQMFA